MRQSQQKVLDSLRRAKDFLATHQDVLGTVSTSETSKELDAAIEAATEHHVGQGTAARSMVGEMSRQRVLAKQLIESHMRPITKFARGKLRGVPDYAELTVVVDAARVPHLLAAARTMAVSAEKYAAQFASAGLAPDTIARLKAATEALAGAWAQRSHAKGLRVLSTTQIGKALTSGRDAVRILDAQIAQILPADNALLSTWRTVSRVEGKTGKVRGSAPAAETAANGVSEKVKA